MFWNVGNCGCRGPAAIKIRLQHLGVHFFSPGIQGGHFHAAISRGVGAVDGLAAVSEGLLRPAFWIAKCLGPLCPRVPVGVRCDAPDPQALAALFEFRRPVGAPNSAQVWEQRSSGRQGAKDRLKLWSNTDGGRASGFLPTVTEDPALPVDILGADHGGIGLPGSGVPEYFVECAAFRVGFPLANHAVFGFGDGPLGTVNNFWPFGPGQDLRGQPTHVQGEIVELPEERVRGDRALVQGGEHMFGPGLGEGQVPQMVECLIFVGRDPAGMGGALHGF